MKNYPNGIYILLQLVFMFALTPAPVQADVAPPPIPIVGGLGTLSYQTTNVQMTSERVEMELKPYQVVDEGNTFYRRGVTVNAWFVMHNTGSQDESMQVVFPLQDMNRCSGTQASDLAGSYTHLDFTERSFEAQINGEPAEITTLTTDHPHKKDGKCKDVDIQMQWAAFKVTFPANEDVMVRVSYLLDNMAASDALFNVGYTLETGAPWKGPIGEAIVVFRFPNVVDDFILPGTTPGYQIMQNEIYWRYENFEPTPQDNINVAFIDPILWAKIRDGQHRIQGNEKDDAAWAQLAESYSHIAHIHGPNIRSEEYKQRAYSTYRDGLKANPTSSVLNAGFADLYLLDCCYYWPATAADWKTVQPYIEKAVRFDPSNEKALELLDRLQSENPDIHITVGPTFTPTQTHTPNPAFTATITETPLPTYIPPNTWTPHPTMTDTPVPPTVAATHPPLKGAIAATTTPTPIVDPQTAPSDMKKVIVSVLAIGVVMAVLVFGRLMRGTNK